MKNTNKAWINNRMKTVNKILSKKDWYASMADGTLQIEADLLRNRYLRGESLSKLLPEAYALVSEAAVRTTGMRPYPVQLLAAIGLHEGKLVQQNTGEGKTLTTAMPAFLNALAGKGVQVVSVNDYLVDRDAKNIGRIHEFLGLTVGCVLSGMNPDEKRKAYGCDITYVTNTELGFDYLRDNMVTKAGDEVLRNLSYCIIDEVDSVLIDEARTPLIISGQARDNSKLLIVCDVLAKQMCAGSAEEFSRVKAIMGEEQTETGDYIIHEKENAITLTATGVKKIEDYFGKSEYADENMVMIRRCMNLALKANCLMKKEKDYIVRDEAVLIVDEFTGRIMDGRQYSDGLHQAIEAKEGVKINPKTQTIASTTYQNFFLKYDKIAGLTGTAYTERKEFKEIYGLKTVVIPTNKPNIRIDHPDRIYLTQKGKFDAVVEEVLAIHKTGRPVLIGTASVETSEKVSRLLSRYHIADKVLNAKQDKEEADIIAQAGQLGAVTVATNMAGRGTDIMLSDEARSAGGLFVIGTEKHESQRIDNQLRGRSGRQGDPGDSVFYVSAEDDMSRLFGSENFKRTVASGAVDDTEELDSKFFRKAMLKAQQKVEADHYASRKNVFDYDKINNQQKEKVYVCRKQLLQMDEKGLEHALVSCMRKAVESIVRECNGQSKSTGNGKSKIDIEKLICTLNRVCPGAYITAEQIENCGRSKRMLISNLQDMIETAYVKRMKVEFADPENIKNIRMFLIQALDAGWMEELKALECLRQDIVFANYAQKDALSEYSIAADTMFQRMIEGVARTACLMAFSAQGPQLDVNIKTSMFRFEDNEVDAQEKENTSDAIYIVETDTAAVEMEVSE